MSLATQQRINQARNDFDRAMAEVAAAAARNDMLVGADTPQARELLARNIWVIEIHIGLAGMALAEIEVAAHA